jgi:bifunctional DNase/RNase
MLLTQVLQRGQDISKRDWKVLRVAIVELRDSTYIGRLFFGDADTGNVVWDCDCRPSDGCWLALKVAPLACCS